jgi:hypothetical protein
VIHCDRINKAKKAPEAGTQTEPFYFSICEWRCACGVRRIRRLFLGWEEDGAVFFGVGKTFKLIIEGQRQWRRACHSGRLGRESGSAGAPVWGGKVAEARLTSIRGGIDARKRARCVLVRWARPGGRGREYAVDRRLWSGAAPGPGVVKK